MREAVSATVLLLLVGWSGACATVPLPQDTRTQWRVGVSQFSGEDLSTENTYLLSSIPLLIVEDLSRCTTHTIDDAEKQSIQKALMSSEIKRRGKELQQLYVSRDQQFFKAGTGAKETSDLSSRITAAEQAIAYLEQETGSGITVASEKPVVFAGNAGQSLLPPVEVGPDSTVASNNLDLLIWGNIEEIQGYLSAKIYAYDALKKTTTTYAIASSREQLSTSMKPIVDKLTRIVLGRPWGSLTVTTDPENAAISVDGVFLGTGSVEVNLIDVGVHAVSASLAGYKSANSSINVGSGEAKQVSLTLAAQPEASVALTSFPSGAAIYSGSTWLGSTPFPLTVPHLPYVVTLSADGFETAWLTITSRAIKSASIVMIPSTVDKSTIIAAQRDRFYYSLGAFVLSVPFPLILYNATNQLTSAYNRALEQGAGTAEKTLLSKQRGAALGGYVGTLFASASLFVSAMIELFSYLDSIELSMH